MHKNLSIFNSKNIPYAFLSALFLICCIEYFTYQAYDGKIFSHEVDQIVHQLQVDTYNRDFILLGDSVGRQTVRQYSNDNRVALLASNQAIEMTGQYFILKRYLDKNNPPKAVIFICLPFLESLNLNQVYTENFVLRTFTNFNEITDIFLIKRDFTMLTKMLSYKFLFSYKHRLSFQKKIIGFTNASIYSGVDKKSSSIEASSYSLMSQYDVFKERRDTTSAMVHFTKVLQLLASKKIDFYYIPVPIIDNNESLSEDYERLFQNYLRSFKETFPVLNYYNTYDKYPESMFSDKAHFNEKGLSRAILYIKVIIDSILNNYS